MSNKYNINKWSQKDYIKANWGHTYGFKNNTDRKSFGSRYGDSSDFGFRIPEELELLDSPTRFILGILKTDVKNPRDSDTGKIIDIEYKAGLIILFDRRWGWSWIIQEEDFEIILSKKEDILSKKEGFDILAEYMISLEKKSWDNKLNWFTKKNKRCLEDTDLLYSKSNLCIWQTLRDINTIEDIIKLRNATFDDCKKTEIPKEVQQATFESSMRMFRNYANMMRDIT